MIALASKPVKTHIVEADYYYRVLLRGARFLACALEQAPQSRGGVMRLPRCARNDKRGEAQDDEKRRAQNDKESICRASLALDRSGPRGCLKVLS